MPTMLGNTFLGLVYLGHPTLVAHVSTPRSCTKGGIRGAAKGIPTVPHQQTAPPPPAK